MIGPAAVQVSHGSNWRVACRRRRRAEPQQAGSAARQATHRAESRESEVRGGECARGIQPENRSGHSDAPGKPAPRALTAERLQWEGRRESRAPERRRARPAAGIGGRSPADHDPPWQRQARVGDGGGSHSESLRVTPSERDSLRSGLRASGQHRWTPPPPTLSLHLSLSSFSAYPPADVGSTSGSVPVGPPAPAMRAGAATRIAGPAALREGRSGLSRRRRRRRRRSGVGQRKGAGGWRVEGGALGRELRPRPPRPALRPLLPPPPTVCAASGPVPRGRAAAATGTVAPPPQWERGVKNIVRGRPAGRPYLARRQANNGYTFPPLFADPRRAGRSRARRPRLLPGAGPARRGTLRVGPRPLRVPFRSGPRAADRGTRPPRPRGPLKAAR